MQTESNVQEDLDCCRMKSVQGYCPKPLEHVSSYITRKWAISIVVTIGNFEKLRFNNLLERLEAATPKILTERLRELEQEGIVTRTEFAELPRRVEYELTGKGRRLQKALVPLSHWAERHS